jgi:hypothetical protein
MNMDMLAVLMPIFTSPLANSINKNFIVLQIPQRYGEPKNSCSENYTREWLAVPYPLSLN